MSDTKAATTGGGVGLGSLCFLTTVVFAILKLAGILNWSWWLVFTPLLAYAGLITLVIIIMVIVLIIVAIITAR